MPTQPRMKINRANIWAVSRAKCRTKDKDRLKLIKLNRIKTTFNINMQRPHKKLSIIFGLHEKKNLPKSQIVLLERCGIIYYNGRNTALYVLIFNFLSKNCLNYE